jgi:glycerol-3-phosphate O-acyltransferase/dihydroxyacetone phosphate acyltransferase
VTREQTPGLLRLTAKATQFGKPTFTSWLIESAGTVPIQRQKDYDQNMKVDNTQVMGKLMDVREASLQNQLGAHVFCLLGS